MENDKEALYALATDSSSNGKSILSYLPEAVAGIAGAGGGYMLTRKPVYGAVGAIAGVLTVSAIKALLVRRQDKYSDVCGALPTESGSYCENWWKCAFGVAVTKGICRDDNWWEWPPDVNSDIEAVEGAIAWDCYSAGKDDDDDYVKIFAYPSGELLGRYRWKC